MYACGTGPQREATVRALWCSEKKPAFTEGEGMADVVTALAAPLKHVAATAAPSFLGMQPFPVFDSV